jgi:hypothetical protein
MIEFPDGAQAPLAREKVIAFEDLLEHLKL